MQIKEVFATLQGEGINAGVPAVFVRFAGCNLWSGADKTRARDAQRNNAACPTWCDTDFVKGERCDTAQLVQLIRNAMQKEAGHEQYPLVVFTGGEPLLQLTAPLAIAVKTAFSNMKIAVETNGTVALDDDLAGVLDHVCVSPKTPLATLKIRQGQELKVVVPAIDPNAYAPITRQFDHLIVSPCANVGEAPGISYIDKQAIKYAVDFCLKNPRWRLSQQTHKTLGLR